MSKKQETYVVDANHSGNRLDLFLPEVSSYTRSQVKKLVDRGYIYIGETKAPKAGTVVNEGDVVSIREEEGSLPLSDDASTDLYKKIGIIHETTDYLAVFKPAGLLVHPTEAGEAVTLAAWLVTKYPDIQGVGENPVRPGIVHRLDKEASGLLVIARTQNMFEHLKQQFKSRRVEKEYSVLVYGVIDTDEETLDFPIDRGKDGRMVSRPRMKELTLDTVNDIQPGKEALTEFKVVKRFTRFSLLSVKIHSGRTHQIRVHMYAYAHPVVGDTIYFNKKFVKKSDSKLTRLFLHAKKLCFEDLAGEQQCFEAALPAELQTYLDSLT